MTTDCQGPSVFASWWYGGQEATTPWLRKVELSKTTAKSCQRQGGSN